MEPSFTFEQMLLKFGEIVPHLDDKAEDIMHRDSSLLHVTMRNNIPTDAEILAGRFLGAGILEFICWAYGHPNKGYAPPQGSDE